MSALRVAIETQFAVGTGTGLGSYASGLARGLRARGDVDVVELCRPRHDLWRFDRRVLWDQFLAPRLARAAHADVVHFTGGTSPIAGCGPRVVSVHDAVWARGANRGRWYVRGYFGGLMPLVAKHADALVADTEAARDDIAAVLGVDPRRIFVGGVGVDDEFFSIPRAERESPFVLAAGTIEERKDLATAVRALARIPAMRLVCAGPFTPYVEEVRRTAASSGVADRVDLLGWVEAAALRDLYKRAAALVFPSRYEGFGLPPLQALACGLPVVAARIPPVAEVLGDGAWFVEPGDADGMATALATILAAGPEVGRRVVAGRARAEAFRWPRIAARMVDIYRSVAATA